MLERALAEVRAHRRADGSVLARRRRTACATPRRPAAARLQAGTDPVGRARARAPARCASTSPRQPGLPAARRARARPLRRLVRDLPALRGRRPRRRDRALWTTGTLRTAAEAAARHRRRWASTSSTSPRSTPSARPRRKGPQQHPRRRPRATPAARTPSARPTAATTPSTPTSAPSTTSTPSSPRRARSGSRWRWTSRCSARPTTRGSTTHPEWFTTRADGTIAYAENPPKKYQDIYPLNFDNDPAGHLRRGAPGRAGVDRPRGHASSASTTRTPSRWSSGSG